MGCVWEHCGIMLVMICLHSVGTMEQRSSSLNSAALDDALSDQGPSNLASELVSDDLPLSMLPLTANKPPPPLPTLFESKPQPTGYISTEQFDPLAVDSPDSDSVSTPKLSTKDAASESGYFPMPSILDGSSHEPHQTEDHTSQSSSSAKTEKPGGSELASDYVAAPSDFSSSSAGSKSSLASTSAAVAKKSRQLFAKVLPRKSSSGTSPSKGSKSKGNASGQQGIKQPQQVLAPPPSASSMGELGENDDSDMGDLVDLLDLGDPPEMGTPSYNANGNQSLNTSSDMVNNTSGYFQDSSIGTTSLPSAAVSSTLTSDPFFSAQPLSSTTSSGYFQSPRAEGNGTVNTGTLADTGQPFSDDDDSDAFFLPELPADSETSSSDVTYGGSIVTLSGGQLPTFDNTKK